MAHDMGGGITSTFVYFNIGLTLLQGSSDVLGDAVGLIETHIQS